jgi:cbb3-type cytochrome oxidase subunit 1
MERMNHRISRVPYMLYPEDNKKTNWDMFITLILLWTCISTPARIAFSEEDTIGWTTLKWTIDFLFLIDIIVIFNSAVQDEDFRTIEDRKEIAKIYLSGWLFLDVFAIVPFSDIMSAGSNKNGG